VPFNVTQSPATPHFDRALRLAQIGASAVGWEEVQPAHLLLALLRIPDCAAVRVLERLNVSIEELRERLEAVHPRFAFCGYIYARPSAETERILSWAQGDARRRGASLTATDHLLIGFVAHKATPVARILSDLGVGALEVMGEVDRFHREADEGLIPPRAADDFTSTATRPAAVKMAFAFLLLNLTCLFGIPVSVAAILAAAGGGAAILPALWTWMASAILLVPVRYGFRSGWAGFMAVLFVKTGVAWGCVAWLLARSSLEGGAPAFGSQLVDARVPVLIGLALFLLTRAFFNASTWYGVSARGRWGALRSKGAWWLLLSALHEIVPVVLAVASQGAP
jgi:hypothetical protein